MATLVNEWLAADEVRAQFERAQKRGDALYVVFAAAHHRHALSIGAPVIRETVVREYGASIGKGENQLEALKRHMAQGDAPRVRAVYDCARAFDAARGGRELLEPAAQDWLTREAQAQRDTALGVSRPWYRRVFG